MLSRNSFWGMVVVLFVVASCAMAMPIQYQSTILEDTSIHSSLTDSHWYNFQGTAGDLLTITLRRQEASLDPFLGLFRGVSDNAFNLELVAFADDNLPELPGYEGPFADALIQDFEIIEDGEYSIFAHSYLSGFAGQDGVYDYSLTVSGLTPQAIEGQGEAQNVTEPGVAALFGLSMMGLLGLRRQKKK